MSRPPTTARSRGSGSALAYRCPAPWTTLQKSTDSPAHSPPRTTIWARDRGERAGIPETA